MKTTDLTTNDSDIEVYYGDIKYRDIPRKEAYGHVKYLYADLTDIRKYYIRLGFHLAEFERCSYYFDFGYPTLEDFCQSNLGLDKSAVSRCIGVYREFNAKDDLEFGCGVISKGCDMELSKKWQDYSYTQLCEMLPLSPEQREKISPDMTIKQIRDYKKSLKNKPVASTQQEDPDDDPVVSSQPKRFNYDEYLKKKGIVQQNYIKSCDPFRNVGIYIFDCDGRKVFTGYVGEILDPAMKSDCLVIRMYGQHEPFGLADVQQPDQDGDFNE